MSFSLVGTNPRRTLRKRSLSQSSLIVRPRQIERAQAGSSWLSALFRRRSPHSARLLMIAHCIRNAGSPRCRGIVAATLPNAVTGLYACIMGLTTWAIFLIAAFLEVGGDAIIRMGLRGRGTILIVIGFAVLGSYGLIVNMVE